MAWGLDSAVFLALHYYAIKHHLCVSQNVIICNANDVEIARTQYYITLCIILGLLFVNPTIYLNNNVCRMAIEICDEAIYNLLPSKVQPF